MTERIETYDVGQVVSRGGKKFTVTRVRQTRRRRVAIKMVEVPKPEEPKPAPSKNEEVKNKPPADAETKEPTDEE